MEKRSERPWPLWGRGELLGGMWLLGPFCGSPKRRHTQMDFSCVLLFYCFVVLCVCVCVRVCMCLCVCVCFLGGGEGVPQRTGGFVIRQADQTSSSTCGKWRSTLPLDPIEHTWPRVPVLWQPDGKPTILGVHFKKHDQKGSDVLWRNSVRWLSTSHC